MDPPQSLLDNKPTGFLLKPSYSALKSYSSEEGRAYMEEKLSMEEDRKCLKEGELFQRNAQTYIIELCYRRCLVGSPKRGRARSVELCDSGHRVLEQYARCVQVRIGLRDQRVRAAAVADQDGDQRVSSKNSHNDARTLFDPR